MKVVTGCVTDRGNYREKNQDRAVSYSKNHKGKVLAVSCVCDGIGSFSQSEIAAEMMTEGIARWFCGVASFFPGEIQEKTLVEDLEATVRELNELVCDYRLAHGIDIGCTMSLILLICGNYYIFHVGDSRICKIREDIYQLTRDEVSVMETRGGVRTCLENYIGESAELWMNKQKGAVEEGDVFILGSDGLFKKLLFQDVSGLKRIRSGRQAQKACKRLLKLVMERGERDNISCILLCVR